MQLDIIIIATATFAHCSLALPVEVEPPWTPEPKGRGTQGPRNPRPAIFLRHRFGPLCLDGNSPMSSRNQQKDEYLHTNWCECLWGCSLRK